MRIGRTFGKAAAWLAALAVVIVVALVGFVLTFDWNRARPWIDDKVSDAIGRPFTINGDLTLSWHRPSSEAGWRAWVPWPRLTARNVTVANPDWTRERYFASLDAISFDVAVLPLIAHRIVIPSIDLVNPAVDLERTKDGRTNWTFKLISPGQPSTWTLDLHDIGFAKGNAAYRDALQQANLKVVIDTLGRPIPFGEALKQQEETSRSESSKVVGSANVRKLAAQVRAEAASGASADTSKAAPAGASDASGASGAPAAAVSGASAAVAGGAKPVSAASAATEANRAPSRDTYAIGWTVEGTYKKTRVNGAGKVGGVLALQDASRPFPIQADVHVGDTHIALVGTLTDPAHLAALDLRLWFAGESMAHLYDVTGVTLPETPPYATEGRLVGQFRRSGNLFKYENFTGRVGGSDLNGSLTYESRQPRPSLSGELVSNVLQFSDLAPIIGADSSASKARRGDAAQQPANKLLPVEAFRTERWKAIDADVKFTGRRIIKNQNLPITDLYTHLILKDGVITLDPLEFGVAGGSLSSTVHLDGGAMPLKGRLTMQARHLKLRQLFPSFGVMQTTLGEINGDAALSATGNSPAALAATSNGEVKALVNEGAISKLLMEAAGLNVANVVYERLFGTQDVKINCAAADFVATDGVLDSRVFALDTDDAVIDMDGKVSLRDETMDLTIRPHTKGFRVFSLRSPLYVRGTFKQPHVGVEAGALLVRGGAMLGLGLLNPFAALIPLLQPSNSRPMPCQQMLAEVSKRSSAPPPGVRPPAASGAGGPQDAAAMFKGS
jgi:AsmA family protein